jgi:hypothetical protein
MTIAIEGADGKRNEADDAAFKLFEGVYAEYVKRLGETWDMLTKRLLEAMEKYNEVAMATLSSHDSAQKAFDSMQKELIKAVRWAWTGSQAEFTSSYQCYMRGFRDAWAKTDVDQVSPMTAAIVMKSATTAAEYAQSTIGNWQLISWTGIPPWVLGPQADPATVEANC